MNTTAWRYLAMVGLLVAGGGCGKATDPSEVSLTGRWKGTVGGLGIGFVTLDLIEANNTVTGTGTWTPETGGGQRGVTAQGLHFGGNLQLSLDFDTPTGTETLVLPGGVDGANTFHLTFPTDPTPKKVTFTR